MVFNHRYYAEYFELLVYLNRLIYSLNRYSNGKHAQINNEIALIYGRLNTLEKFLIDFCIPVGNCGDYIA
jgi:hypothetical protein